MPNMITCKFGSGAVGLTASRRQQPRQRQGRCSWRPAATNSTNGTSTLTSSAPDGVVASEASSSSSTPAMPAQSIVRAKLALLSEVAGLNRGALATRAQKQAVEQLISVLEGASQPPAPFAGSPAALEGRWELLYANTEAFRASPFFLAFANLVGSQQLSDAIFAFTDAIPGAEIGAAYQTVSLLSAQLISEVDMEVFPGFKGTVVTTSTISPLPPASLQLEVQNTRVSNSTFSPFLDNVVVPVDDIMARLSSPEVTSAVYDITYLDDQLRVTRAGDQLMLHRRVL